MQDFPHHYRVSAATTSAGTVALTSPGLGPLESAGPAEFGGPGDKWSPETLMTAAVADCFILSFRAVARASRLEWLDLRCDVVGVLENVDKVIRFTEFRIRASLHVPAGVAETSAVKALERAKKHCLITNSLAAASILETDVLMQDATAVASAV